MNLGPAPLEPSPNFYTPATMREVIVLSTTNDDPLRGFHVPIGLQAGDKKEALEKKIFVFDTEELFHKWLNIDRVNYSQPRSKAYEGITARFLMRNSIENNKPKITLVEQLDPERTLKPRMY